MNSVDLSSKDPNLTFCKVNLQSRCQFKTPQHSLQSNNIIPRSMPHKYYVICILQNINLLILLPYLKTCIQIIIYCNPHHSS